MSSVGKSLYNLQQADLTIRSNRKRLQEIHAELANQAPVKRAQKQVDSAEEALKPLQTNLRDLELQVQTTKQKHDQSQNRLYSGAVSNPKELQDIEQNIASLKRRQSDLEDKQLELMMAIEEAQEKLSNTQTTLEQVLQETASNNQDLLTEQETLESQVETLTSNRESLRAKMPSEQLALYDDLQPKMGHRPIAILTDESACSICGVQQTSLHAQEIKQSDTLLRCASCNRILIAI